MSQFVLVDVSSIAYPIWHTSASSSNPNEASQQIVARVLALASGAPHVALCCDSGRSFRADIDTTYKANRPEREAALTHQITLAMDTLKAAGFPLWSKRGFEADDLIASAVVWALQDNEATVLIVSADKDLLQLVGPRVHVKNARDGAIVDDEAVALKFGVYPHQMRDFLTLCGDASDNVKGVKGIGAKRAAELLQAHGSIDALYEKIDQGIVPGVTPAMRTALLDFRPLLDTTRSLITLRTDVDLPFADLTQPRVSTQAQTFDIDEDDDMEPTEQPQDTTPEPVTETATAPAPQAIAIRQEALAPAPAEWNKQLEPRSMGEAGRLAKHVHESLLFTGTYGTPQAVLSTILAGRELGLQAMASLRAIHIIEGKPALSADLIRALVIRSGLASYFRCTERTAERATFVTKRGDDPEMSLSFTIQEARQAWSKTQDAWDKSAWNKNPADMLVARAGAKLARLVYPDVVHGIYCPEELTDQRAEVA